MAPTSRKRRRNSPPLAIPVPPSLRPPAEPAAAGPSSMTRTAPTEDPSSLEDDADDEESHFVGTGVFSSLILPSSRVSSAFTREGILSFRQVSTDEQHPAYFIKHPSFLYGRAPNSGQDAFRTACALVPEVTAERAIEALVRITLPAFPFIDGERLVASTRTSPRYALLTGIMAHCTSYLPDIAPLRKELWAQALLGLEDEYRQPRLRTLQLAILVLCSRPSENAGQCEIGLGRAAGAAQLLGLHIDPTFWTLPDWEKSIRRRIWWSLVVHDKWRALLYGRPCQETHNVRIPEVEGDSRDARLSMLSFVAECHLTEIVDRVVFVDAAIHRAGEMCKDAFAYAATLAPEAHEAWSPYASLHISNSISFALQLILKGNTALLPFVTDFFAHVVSRCNETHWDVLESALKRSATLLLIASRQVPELQETYRAVQVCLGLDTVNQESPLSLEALLAPLGDLGDLSWLDGALLGALGDASLL
ncbi:hypothetical protein A1Q1_01083 [Trichosporon asahii var. asahii CBS 2479]|uniref:Xylanolytic transcriptional activator regulatory domain-containing protein n=1 Tax=Trichosporon asahii var. asahii (strain ATCC 90039 / CBS 2479 / JCM 2466 / KCTC 7840 / NBRC 103889/ NCYC 2677 / UAMH 7654) TaxID=1186058 RepID=J6EYM6_TRIAS|nr:hypothetical protein A1Q1_01083 [Trichosporon asahii var. asahii CBS 2479]EJT49769.1 hypothetical protein A1Q1_01083 [Trichosporon asahii var. asahii CBS 2479]